jgi:hypothetical protein
MNTIVEKIIDTEEETVARYSALMEAYASAKLIEVNMDQAG